MESDATPDGWTFVIPTHQVDYCVGYCYNDNITSELNAELNFRKMFDEKEYSFSNYVAKEPVDGRVFKNGNRLFFLVRIILNTNIS